MSNTSLPQQAPMTNGIHAPVNGEADVSCYPTTTPPAVPPSLEQVCAILHGQVSAFLATSPQDDVTRRTQEQTRISMSVIAKALDDYGFPALSLSYNGGKDCLVLLILYLAVLHSHFTSTSGIPTSKERAFPTSIPSIYAKPPDPFPAVSEFVEYSSALYHLDLTHILTSPGPSRRKDKAPTAESTPEKAHRAVSFRDAFALYLSTHPSVRAIFVGTRRTDPHGGHLTHFDATDHNWPTFMRVHPVIDWHLSEIWCFLRARNLTDLGVPPRTETGTVVEGDTGREVNGVRKGESETDERFTKGAPLRYCEMYDQGYTSLGGVNDTVRNPKLRYLDGDGRERYKPAYEMTWDEGERLGRE